jgi:hypothetical protein
MTRDSNRVDMGQGGVIGALSFGAGSRATQSGTIRVETGPASGARDVALVIGLLDGLLARIEMHAAALPEADTARSAAHVLRDEVGQPDSDPAVMRRMIDRLRSAVGSVSALARIAADLTAAMKPWLG